MGRTTILVAVAAAGLALGACDDSHLVAREARTVMVVTSGAVPAETPAQRPLIVQRALDDGSWLDVRKLVGSSDGLLTLPAGEYRVWDYDVQIATFTIGPSSD